MVFDRLDALAHHRHREPAEFWAVALWGVACTAVHFSSMALFLYAQIWWWDLFVHAASGFGVAGVLYVLRPREATHPIGLWLVLPLSVLAIGTWFEVYERLLTDFWHHWSLSFYWTDTVEDLVADAAGAVAFSVVLRLKMRIRGERPSRVSLGRRLRL